MLSIFQLAIGTDRQSRNVVRQKRKTRCPIDFITKGTLDTLSVTARLVGVVICLLIHMACPGGIFAHLLAGASKAHSGVNTLPCPKHALFPAQLALASKILPLHLTGLKLASGLDFSGHLRRACRRVADLARLFARLICQCRVDICRGRDNTRMKGLWGWGLGGRVA